MGKPVALEARDDADPSRIIERWSEALGIPIKDLPRFPLIQAVAARGGERSQHGTAIRAVRAPHAGLPGHRDRLRDAARRAARPDRADLAARRPRSADGGTELHRRVRPPVRIGLGSQSGQTIRERLKRSWPVLHLEAPDEPAANVGVHDADWLSEGQ